MTVKRKDKGGSTRSDQEFGETGNSSTGFPRYPKAERAYETFP